MDTRKGLLADFSNSKYFLYVIIGYLFIYMIISILIVFKIIKWPQEEKLRILKFSGPLRERFMCSIDFYILIILPIMVWHWIESENSNGILYIINEFTSNGALGWGFLLFFGAVGLLFLLLISYFIFYIVRIWVNIIKKNGIISVLFILYDLIMPLFGIVYLLNDFHDRFVFVFIGYGMPFLICFLSSEPIGGRRSQKEEMLASRIIWENCWNNNQKDYNNGYITEEQYNSRKYDLTHSDSFEVLSPFEQSIYRNIL